MPRSLITFIAVAALSACPPTRQAVTGTYRFAPNPTDSIAGCGLGVEELPGRQVRFQVSCNRGAPSYNMGWAAGTAPLEGTTMTWRTHAYGDPCTLTFTFSQQAVVVTEDATEGACGFGHGVTADGQYRKVDDQLPGFLSLDGSVTTSFPVTDPT